MSAAGKYKCMGSDGVEESPAKQLSTIPSIHSVSRLLTTSSAGYEHRMELRLSAFEGLSLEDFPHAVSDPRVPGFEKHDHEQKHVSTAARAPGWR